MAAVQKTKVRPILNLSAPKGNSFNDAVDPFGVDKLKMSSAKLFSEAIIKAGQGAIMAKTDIKDAYKLIPNAKTQWRLYGFRWLNKYFFDRSTVFGSQAAPACFDCLPETIVNIICCQNKIPRKWIHRQLDDVPIVSPKESGWTSLFYEKYQKICKEINVPLAENCAKNEKAFGPSTFGTVLGINFCTERMEWFISEEKANSILYWIKKFLDQKICTLKEAQKLHGKLNHFAQVCDFMMGFRSNLMELIRKFKGSEAAKKLIPAPLKADLQIWAKTIVHAKFGLPIRDIFDEPPLYPVRFISDAAGAVFEWKEGICKNVTEIGDPGVASIGFAKNEILSVSILKWPISFMKKKWGAIGKGYGSRSAVLEAIGLLLPFLQMPKALIGKHILLEVDNATVVYAWEKKYNKRDTELSILIRCLHVFEAFLGCKIYVKHTKRMSNDMAKMADKLSRSKTTDEETLRKIAHITVHSPTGALIDWINTPGINWNLPLLLIGDIENKLS
jgi:hypothetical protein